MSSPLKIEAYHVIICGGGTAGCVLAARLSEDPSLQVLMIEAGADANDDPRITTPALFATTFGDAERDWQFMAEPSPGLNGRKMAHGRGKCIGGSSAINLMAMIYPSKAGLDAWADLGNPGWDWKTMAPYYRKFQTHVAPPPELRDSLMVTYLDSELAGTSGPIQASFPQTHDPIQKAWVDTWKKLGHSGNPIDGTGYGGFTTPNAVDVKTGKRSFAGTAYYAPVAHRSNLHVVTSALIERVELEVRDPETVRATGVTFSLKGEQHTAKAQREVILCSGVFGSPSILERSGIGSAGLCEEMGIKNVIDNPNVGENMQDHLMAGISFEVKDGIKTTDMFRDPAVIEAAMKQYQATQNGPLAGGGGYSFSYCPLANFITPQTQAGDLKVLLDEHLPPASEPKFKAEKRHYDFIRRIIESPNETSATLFMITSQFNGHRLPTKDLFTFHEPENYVSIITQMSHPFSRGSVHINSSDAQAKPTITPNYLEHALDVQILARHLMQCEALAKCEPLHSLLKPAGRRLPDGQRADTLEAAIEFARANATSQYHPSGTCAMMPEELGGVVNERLMVHGTANLRVVDASIFPIEPRGNIMTSVYATAEKGAELIREDLTASRR